MRVGLLAATLAVLIPLSALADDQMIGVDIIEESQGFSMWVDIMSVGEKTRGDGLMSVFTAPVEIGRSVVTQIKEDPGESLVMGLLAILSVDQMANGGDITQLAIDTVRDKDSGGSSSTPHLGDRDFIAASDGSCTAAALHSKDIELEYSGSSGSCTARIFEPGSDTDE